MKKRETENTKRLNDEEYISKKYTEIHHNKNTVINESTSTVFLDADGWIIKQSADSIILPPSNVFIGKRLSIPKDMEAKIKKLILGSCIP